MINYNMVNKQDQDSSSCYSNVILTCMIYPSFWASKFDHGS